MTTSRHVLHVQLFLPKAGSEALYARVLDELQNITPLVQAIPPDSADLDVTGSLRFWKVDVHDLAYLVQARLVALLGLREACVGAGGNRMLAAMAAAVTPPGRVTVVGTTQEAVAAFLRPQPVAALPGIGPATARSLRRYGIATVGAIADLPPVTLQRILGAAAGRAIRERALGHDPRPVAPAALPRSHSRKVDFPADVLDHRRHRAALLSLAEQLGGSLREDGQVAGSMTLTVRYADASTSVRTRVLPEYTAHSAALARAAHELYQRLGLQRARVRGIRLRMDDLRPADQAAQQLSLEPQGEKARAAEAASDRARARFGASAVLPATLAPPSSRRR